MSSKRESLRAAQEQHYNKCVLGPPHQPTPSLHPPPPLHTRLLLLLPQVRAARAPAASPTTVKGQAVGRRSAPLRRQQCGWWAFLGQPQPASRRRGAAGRRPRPCWVESGHQQRGPPRRAVVAVQRPQRRRACACVRGPRWVATPVAVAQTRPQQFPGPWITPPWRWHEVVGCARPRGATAAAATTATGAGQQCAAAHQRRGQPSCVAHSKGWSAVEPT